MRIKCAVCKKIREHARGVREKIFGSEFHVGVYAKVPMCAKCRRSIMDAAFKGATDKYLELFEL